MIKRLKLIIPFLSFLGIIFISNFVLAASFGINIVNNGLAGSLTMTDPRILIGRIIQIALSFLGVIAVSIIIYAGFLWMTSNGDEEKITSAKKILKNAIIGLVIILSSWAIATFIISRLAAAMIGVNVPVPGPPTGPGFNNPGIGVIGACTIQNTYPTNGQQNVPRNTSLIISFKNKVKLDTVCVDSSGSSCACSNTSSCDQINPAAVRLYTQDLGDACSKISCPKVNTNNTDISVQVSSDHQTLLLIPRQYLGRSNGDTPYTVKFTNVIRKVDNSSMFATCSTNYAAWNFTVSNKLDLVPPIVVPNGIFPPPDNARDIINQTSPAQAAHGQIIVQARPNIYSPAKVLSVTAENTATPSTARVLLDYQGSITEFKISVSATAPNQAQLFDVHNNPLGVASFNSSGQAVFKGFMTFIAPQHPAGSLWDIKISPEKLADNLTINSLVYTFASSSLNNNILVPNNFSNNQLASNIEAKISGNSAINVSLNGSTVNLSAKVQGLSGNNIAVSTSNSPAIQIIPLTGGRDRKVTNQFQDKPDQPLNTVIQINFNKAINPLTISGPAEKVVKYIKVVNANASSSSAGAVCSNNAQCQSYKCSNNTCVGNYLDGNFMVSNAYHTVEFTSNQECGINACGEKIYCLPSNSHLTVKLTAADLQACTSDKSCWADGSFRTCSASSLAYSTCQNSSGQNYPAADATKLDGVLSASLNSLDGNRDGVANGPISFYNDNYTASSTVNLAQKDNYQWSFYISDKLNLNPPIISNISPIQGQKKLKLTVPVNITFNKLMMKSTLQSGAVKVINKNSKTEHHLINLYSLSPSPLGYWLSAQNKDLPPYDGFPDITQATIFHSPLKASATFQAQVGSGVKDIYQNCYKPSAGPSCAATSGTPSCCFGSPTKTLGTNGNCQ